jgi:hypothetical protein
MKQIVFGQAEETWPLSDFSLVATNSIHIHDNNIVSSGNIGVLYASSGPWLNAGVEVSLGSNVLMRDGVQIYGDSVNIGSNSSVWDVFYNDLTSKGTIRGEATQGLELPLPIKLPDFPVFSPGGTDFTVSRNQSRTLEPGNYRNVVVQSNGTLTLSGGEYNLNDLTFQGNVKLIFLSRTEIRIKNRLSVGDNVQILAGEEGLGAKDLTLYVEGINGSDGALKSKPVAAGLGKNGIVNANFYVPNGTLSIADNAKVTGSLIAKDISFLKNITVELESGF